jgi:histidyl-tRNA synthetase
VFEDGKKSKWTFKHAERVGAKRLLTIGKKEQEEGIVKVKNLETREEVDVSLDKLA